MKTKKNIDRLYLSKFEGAEAIPPEDAWRNIASRLPEEKRSRKLLPFWIPVSAAAVVALLLLNLGIQYFNSPAGPNVAVTPVPRENIYKEIRLATTSFNETMLKTSINLQAIMQQKSNIEAKGSSLSNNRTGFLTGTDLNSGSNDGLIARFNSEEGPKEAGEIVLENGNLAERPSETDPGAKPEPKALEQEQQFLSGPNEILLAEHLNEEKVLNEPASEPSGKLSISTRVAPVFFDNMGGRNTSDRLLHPNSGGGEVSLSYGINLAYEISDKIRIRSGVNKLDLSYSTPGVPMATAMNSAAFGAPKKSFILATAEEGNLQQQMGFLEVPVELEYRLIDQRFGLNLIAGGSTLFLNRNEVSINSGNHSTHLGEANNLKDMSYSANLGLGLDYELVPQFRLNIEPIFKYQLNTFTNSSELRPYYFGIYSGFSFSF